MSGFLPIRSRHTAAALKALKEDNATGPDLLGTTALSLPHGTCEASRDDCAADYEAGPMAQVLEYSLGISTLQEEVQAYW